MMDEWFLYKICDYWDSNTDVLKRLSDKIGRIKDKAQLSSTLHHLSEAIKEHVRVLSDSHLHMAAFAMVEDLYKSANSVNLYDVALLNYLKATSETFLICLRARGFVLHYLVDNTFPCTYEGMNRPLDLFPEWFGAMGMVYICPQKIALLPLEKDGFKRSDYYARLPQYIDEARHVSNMIIEKCRTDKRHYIFLDTGVSSVSYAASFASSDLPGVITIYRNESPLKGSKCMVRYPTTPLSNDG